MYLAIPANIKTIAAHFVQVFAVSFIGTFSAGLAHGIPHLNSLAALATSAAIAGVSAAVIALRIKLQKLPSQRLVEAPNSIDAM